MTSHRFTPAAPDRECFRLLDTVADGSVRCRKPAVVTVCRIPDARGVDWCRECFVEFWDGLPAVAEVLQRGVIEL
jgi:hypothetical protein